MGFIIDRDRIRLYHVLGSSLIDRDLHIVKQTRKIMHVINSGTCIGFVSAVVDVDVVVVVVVVVVIE